MLVATLDTHTKGEDLALSPTSSEPIVFMVCETLQYKQKTSTYSTEGARNEPQIKKKRKRKQAQVERAYSRAKVRAKSGSSNSND